VRRDGKPLTLDDKGYPRPKFSLSKRNPDTGKPQKVQIRFHTLYKLIEIWKKIETDQPLTKEERVWWNAHTRGSDEDLKALKENYVEVSHHFASRKDSVPTWVEAKTMNQGRANDVHCFDRLICGVCKVKVAFPCRHEPRCQDDHVGCCEGCREDNP
jgi:hypothetical protein